MKKKIVIIGGGIAGLSAGVYARINGFETEIIEMHTIPGGQCTTWKKDGYKFDYCLHWLVGTSGGTFNEVWKTIGAIDEKTQIIDHDIHTRIIGEDGDEFIIYTSIDKWEKYLIDKFPDDMDSIKRMCKDMRKGSTLDSFINPPGTRNIGEYLKVIKMLPALKLIGKFGKKSCMEYFNSIGLKNGKLSKFLNGVFGDSNFSALAFIMMLSWLDQKNAGYLIGGSLPLAERVAHKYKSLGGKFRFGKKVKRIIVNNNEAQGVELDDGTIINSDYVISAADGHATIFDMLEGKYLSEKIKEAYSSWELFTPIVQVSFGVNKVIPTDTASTMILNKGLNIGSTKLETGYSIMNYAFDPTMAPQGKTSIVIRFESPWEIWKDLDGDEYLEEKEQIGKDAAILLEKRYPGSSEFIETIDIATPKTDVRYTGVWQGSYEGFKPTSGNITKILDRTLPGLRKFYMAGQWLTPGGGLPPSAQSGRWAIQLISKEEKVKFRID